PRRTARPRPAGAAAAAARRPATPGTRAPAAARSPPARARRARDRRGARSRSCPCPYHVLPPPRLDPRVVAGEQHVGDAPAAELRRSRVVRILEAAAELGGEALELAGALRERARQPAGNRVEDEHCRQIAVREDVRPDRDRIRR